MGRMVLYTRDLAQLFSTYISPRDPQVGIRAARHLALFGWVLKSNFRETPPNDIVETLLVAPASASYVLGQRKRPVAILARLRQLMIFMEDSVPWESGWRRVGGWRSDCPATSRRRGSAQARRCARRGSRADRKANQ